MTTRTRARQCGTKKPHATAEAARVHMFRLAREGACLGSLNVYRCRHARKGQPHWHVGHVPHLGRSK